ncbi:hypothetical protein SAMN04515674_104235 [Pseudarcicella hirudinis]|uniref:Uncharacterized protein n=1 Tax=Pseudarcicella hirudinis TaxID=1079859 RepID=A0A1I5RU37_9BACT|nr:hypothetical protein SAMN04515674_104235 [Pseudarcicella hirudinis]
MLTTRDYKLYYAVRYVISLCLTAFRFVILVLHSRRVRSKIYSSFVYNKIGITSVIFTFFQILSKVVGPVLIQTISYFFRQTL